MIKFPKIKESIPKITDDIINGFSRRLKLIPLFSIAIISVSFAIFEVKKITETIFSKEVKENIRWEEPVKKNSFHQTL